MRSLLLGLVCATACADSPSGTLMLMTDTHEVAVGGSTFVSAYLYDGTTADPKPIEAEWSIDAPEVVKLTPTFNIQKVTGLAAGHVVVTASAYDQTAQTGFTVVP